MPVAVRTVIMGAAGRDFHNFNVFFRNNPSYKVVAFTATQIPGIEGRTYPKTLSGKRYPKGIPILSESDLPKIIKEKDIDLVVLAYSDLSNENVMHKASVVLAAGADFSLMGPKSTMLKSKRPMISVCGENRSRKEHGLKSRVQSAQEDGGQSSCDTASHALW